MLDYKPSAYVTWIKHLSDYSSDSDILIEKGEGLDILVHPSHKPLSVPRSDNLYNVIDKEDKTIQLYFYSLAWLVPVLAQGNEEKIATALDVVEDILDIAPEDERSGAWNMLWDDHAVCERLCVIIELLSNAKPSLSINNDKFERHLEKVYCFIETLVASNRWLNNNHRLFHFLASFVYHHYKGDDEKVDEFVSHISDFCHNLIDVKTGFAREQCISYCFFDINVVGKVVNTLSCLSINIDFDIDKTHEKLLQHINAIAFPDDMLPASGDTPYGLKLSSFQKKHAAPKTETHEHWERLEQLGFYRGESESKDVQFLMLQHNGESAHGHYSPLHIDIWFANFGSVLVDVGGPYKYGNKERYEWFRASRGHNALSFDDANFSATEKMRIDMKQNRSGVAGFARYGEASHGRNLDVLDGELSITEFVFSEKPWKIFYNFALGLTLTAKGDGEFLVTNCDGESLLLNFTLSNINISLENTKRCTGSSLSEDAPSLIVSSPLPVVFFKLYIKRLEPGHDY